MVDDDFLKLSLIRRTMSLDILVASVLLTMSVDGTGGQDLALILTNIVALVAPVKCQSLVTNGLLGCFIACQYLPALGVPLVWILLVHFQSLKALTICGSSSVDLLAWYISHQSLLLYEHLSLHGYLCVTLCGCMEFLSQLSLTMTPNSHQSSGRNFIDCWALNY